MTESLLVDAQDGIKITSQNLSRFKKRLHKALKESGFDISYSEAAQIFAKTCGKKNDHELNTLLTGITTSKNQNHFKPVDVNFWGKSTCLKENGSFVNEQMIKGFNQNFADFERNIGFFFSEVPVYASLYFTRYPKNPGSFSFIFKYLYQDEVFVISLVYEDFSFVKQLGDDKLISVSAFISSLKYQVNKLLNAFHGNESAFEDIVLSRWGVKPGERYAFHEDPHFDNIFVVSGVGHYKEKFLAISNKDFMEIKQNLFSDFLNKTASGFKKNKYVNIINDNFLMEKDTLKEFNSLKDVLTFLKESKEDINVFQVLNYVEDKQVNVSSLSSFCMNKVKNNIYFKSFGEEKDIVVNEATDLFFLRGILEKQYSQIKTPVNNVHYPAIKRGFNY